VLCCVVLCSWMSYKSQCHSLMWGLCENYVLQNKLLERIKMFKFGARVIMVWAGIRQSISTLLEA